MREFIADILAILLESAPFLILGFALAGVLHVVLTRHPGITRRLTGPGRRPVFMAALIGAPMPLCSCTVLPAALALRRKGASRGATASFLISVPETDIVSILVTFAMIGPFMGIYRPLAAIASALATGLAIRALEARARRTPAGAADAPVACGCEDAGHAGAGSATRPWWARAFHYGFVEMFDDIAPQLFLGILLAAVIGAWMPDIRPDAAAGTVLTYLLMLAVGIPLYVCAAASTPIAAGLIAGGISPGAAMVFLLAGPATNLGSLVVLRPEFGARLLAAYVALIAITSVAAGALFDVLAGSLSIPPADPLQVHEHVSWWQAACAVLLLAWIAVSFHRSRLLPRLRERALRATGRAPLRGRL